MKKLLLFLCVFCFNTIQASERPWSDVYQYQLIGKAGSQMAKLSTYPVLQYPNAGYNSLFKHFPNEKVLIFAYGSLINKASASDQLSAETLDHMTPVIAFGAKRIFNYKSGHSAHWGTNQDPLEKAMLNIVPSTSYSAVINGMVLEVNAEELKDLVEREKGYDLVPILVADWDQVKNENPEARIRVAYAFVVAHEIRDGIAYSQRAYYPVRGYLNAIRKSAARLGQDYLAFFDATTYLADGTTLVRDWDQRTFNDTLVSQEP